MVVQARTLVGSALFRPDLLQILVQEDLDHGMLGFVVSEGHLNIFPCLCSSTFWKLLIPVCHARFSLALIMTVKEDEQRKERWQGLPVS